MSDTVVIGVDLGGTKIASAIVDRSGAVLASRHANTDAGSGESAVLDRLASEIAALASDAGDRVSAVGIGSPGLVDARAGTVTGAVNLGWARVELAKEVRRRLPRDLPVYIEKDTNAGVLGEMYFGNAKGSRDVVLLTIGTGFGAGVISGGHLIIGGRTAATDIGHLSLDPHGRACICGARGCLETTLSGAGVLAVARELAKAGRHTTSLPEGETWTPAQILTAARASDPLAIAVIDEMARVLGSAMGICAVMFDPDCIIVGGGLGEASADLLLPRAEKAMLGHMGPTRVRPKILPSAVRSSAVGAACIAFAGAG